MLSSCQANNLHIISQEKKQAESVKKPKEINQSILMCPAIEFYFELVLNVDF